MSRLKSESDVWYLRVCLTPQSWIGSLTKVSCEETSLAIKGPSTDISTNLHSSCLHTMDCLNAIQFSVTRVYSEYKINKLCIYIFYNCIFISETNGSLWALEQNNYIFSLQAQFHQSELEHELVG
jgi:hypothetical protein